MAQNVPIRTPCADATPVHALHPSTTPSRSSAPLWRVGLDTGGTFTDLVGTSPEGEVLRVKIPSDGSIVAEVVGVEGRTVEIRMANGAGPHDGALERLLEGWTVGSAEGPVVVLHQGGRIELSAEIALAPSRPIRFLRLRDPIDAPRLGLHILTRTPLGTTLPPIELRLSTTRGTNALLEGRGARVGVIVSDGLSGVVEIGDQTRDELFARVPTRTASLAHAVRAIPERSLADGSLDHTASPADLLRAAEELARLGCDRVVISLAHALANGRERELCARLAAKGVAAISARAVAPHPRLLTRTETACVHARIEPILTAFVDDATKSAPRARSFVFTSAGVLQPAGRLLARDTLYSGPAGGARAVADRARRHGLARAVGFDMGGTSSDISRVADGAIALRSESRLGRWTVAAPSVAIDSVAAGGGSICRVRDGALEVGPESAGANPGPACYGRGGPLTITDVNLLAGRLASAGALALDRGAAERALAPIAAERGVAPETALAAFLDIADARMALAIESLCVRDGVDPRGHALIAFGGAGGQHACAIADRLGIDTIVFPRFAGFLSAAGVLASVPARFATVPVLRPLSQSARSLGALRAQAVDEATAALRADGFDEAGAISVDASLRLLGQEATLCVPFGTAAELAARFATRFRELFGDEPPPRAIELVAVEARVEARVEACVEACATEGGEARGPLQPIEGSDDAQRFAAPSTPDCATMLSEGRRTERLVTARDALRRGECVDGPRIVSDLGATVVLDRSWRAAVDDSRDLVAKRSTPPRPRESAAEQELFAARLEAIARSMGLVLERTALSPNIRDRLDFSCAVLDRSGTLVQNAPHLPVHLGALGICTRAVVEALDLGDGDVAVTNHPAFGGSHLPDVTTVAPVFVDGARVAFVAVRAHHAEIGGTRPGSFPPDAASLAEEGVVLAPFVAVRAGAFDADACRARFAGGAHPSRNPDENLADLRAQIAASRHGVAQVALLARELGARFAERCSAELDRAARAMAAAIARLPFDRRSARTALEDGSPVVVSAERRPTEEGPPLRVSFAGSAGTHRRNFNAPLAVTRAATLYVLRLALDEPIPMNEGLLRAIELDVPEGLLNPRFSEDPLACPPVVAGNVETSQGVVAALIDLFDLAAESQSTMNNTLFGNERFTVYETLGGGAGAGPGSPGASGVHVHMSNTRLTDIDVLERRAPVVIRRFELRAGSGGAGRMAGGDGLVRSYEFRERVSLSFFGSRRAQRPRGAHGGLDGAGGREQAVVKGQAISVRGASISLELAPGDRFTVETPGGGGWGAPER